MAADKTSQLSEKISCVLKLVIFAFFMEVEESVIYFFEFSPLNQGLIKLY